ncbi:unnamed protein product, partial [marine sediment metagenome]
PVGEEITINGIVEDYMSWKVVKIAESEMVGPDESDGTVDEDEENGPSEEGSDVEEGETSEGN